MKRGRMLLNFVLILSVVCALIMPSVDATNTPAKILYDTIAEQAELDNQPSQYVTGVDGINFSERASSTNGKGVYTVATTAKDIYPIHYYRGDVTNNNVLFANMCWEIVRTTETGGVKLIYNGKSVNGACVGTNASDIETNYQSDRYSPTYAGYVYGSIYTPKSKYIGDDYCGKGVDSSHCTEHGYYKFGQKVEWDADTKAYTLKTTQNGAGHETANQDKPWSENWEYDRENIINNHHYTCFTTSHECGAGNPVYYIIYADSSSRIYYIELKNGKKIEDALRDMFNNKTEKESVVKQTVEKWYEENLNTYTPFIEDTIYCNDREVSILNAWNPTGGDTKEEYMYFAPYSRAVAGTPSLSCSNKRDAFTVEENKEGNGLLKYPVGLLTSDEVMYAGGLHNVTDNSDYWLNSGHYYWIMSPYYFDADSRVSVFNVEPTGNLDWRSVELTESTSNGQKYVARPVISLKEKAIYTDGDGSEENPYQVLAKEAYQVEYKYNGEVPSDAPALPETLAYAEGEEITVAPSPTIEGYTFTGWTTEDVTITDGTFEMPSKNVTLVGTFTKKAIISVPKTLDNIYLWLGMMALSIVALIVGIVIYRKKIKE